MDAVDAAVRTTFAIVDLVLPADGAVDADPQVVIWHVQAGRETTPGDLTGAWVLPRDNEAIAGLLEGRSVLLSATAAAESERLLAGVNVPPVLTTPERLYAQVADTLADYKQQFAAEKAARVAAAAGKKISFSAPRWPRLPAPPAPGQWPAAPVPPGGEPGTERALGVALWLTQLIDTWEDLERLRAARVYLSPDLDRIRRPLVASASAEE